MCICIFPRVICAYFCSAAGYTHGVKSYKVKCLRPEVNTGPFWTTCLALTSITVDPGWNTSREKEKGILGFSADLKNCSDFLPGTEINHIFRYW